ncbi:MAG: hypothetical protein CVU57_04205 [Deltaproteobacteria bacterium HGW-Deltaproteobacteria-15]|jgi:hypothetical protein|nr:MAG: hypothetical protein CVU57_04205 [Deltaproteobacteria bacterium HGW-Deltaproteobacteria-15]
MNLFDARIEQYRDLKEEILKGEPPKPIESFEEACIGIAASWKRAIRESGLSREQVVDRINEFFGWGNGSKKALSIHMFNHYLSKPIQYPPPAYLVFPIQHITGSLEPTKAFAEPEDAKVISGDEVRQMALGKLDETILEMQRLKKELRGKK